jgi:hypothetical protein
MACQEQALLTLLDDRGVAESMATAERMGDLNDVVRREGHIYAHAIGLAAYDGADRVGEVFESCTASYQSGCYHGVIQSYFADATEMRGGAGVSAESVNELCADHRAAGGSRWLLFQCAHGIGHGVTTLYAHDLPRGLAACDLIADDWERSACYGGAFMENVVQATAPHHTVGRPDVQAISHDGTGHDEAGHDAGGHAARERDQHAGHAMEPAFPPLDPDDPLYPCNVLEDRYLLSCYQMQTSAILFFNGGDVAATAAICAGAPELYRITCYQSLGRDISALTLQDHEAAIELCDLAGPTHQYDCQSGYVKNVIDVTAEAADGFEFCRAVREAEGRALCNMAVGEQIWVLATDESRREALCEGADAAHIEQCRRGAGLVRAGATPLR